MAAVAADLLVRAMQRKIRLVVIEARFLSPRFFRVALLAVLTQIPFVVVVLLVAVEAF